MPSTALGVGDSFAGYTIEGVLGRGGMGAVFVGRHERLDRRAAIKVLVPELAEDQSFRERFIRESQLAASLEHPNVIPIYDADEIDGVLFIAMRFVAGQDLGVLLVNEGRLSPRQTTDIVDQVAGALDAAHAADLVHRDVKPANILIESTGGHVYLSDFGVAKRTSSTSMTKTGLFLGSVDYCAPEQIHGQPLDGRADTYSLGCVAFHCLVGEPPFQKDTEIAVIQAHLNEPVPALSTVRPGLPLATDGVLATAMAKYPPVRFESSGAFATGLRSALTAEAAPVHSSGTTVASHQPVPRQDGRTPTEPTISSTPQETRGLPARRRRLVLGAVIGGAVVVVAGIVLALALHGSNTKKAGGGGAKVRSANSEIASIVRPLVARQRRVTMLLTSLSATPQAFAQLRSAAASLDSSVLRAQGATSVISTPDQASARGKAALSAALGDEAGYASSLSRIPSPTKLTQAQAAAIAEHERTVDGAFNRTLVARTGPPCCAHMPVSAASVGRLAVVSRQAGAANQLRVFASRIEIYLVQSAGGRTQIRTAIARAQSCTRSAGQAAVQVASVADNRQSLLDQLGNLATPTSQAGQIASLLQSALAHSIEADRHYVDWLNYVDGLGLGSCSLPANDDYTLAQQQDAAATAAKSAFVRAFNPVARRFNLRTWSATEI